MAEARRHVVASAFAVFAGAGQPVPETEVGDKMADLFTMISDEELSVFPRAHEALDGLKRLGVRLALITNGATGQGYPVCSRRAVRPCSDRGRARIRQTRRARLYPFNGGARCRASRHVDGRGQPRTGNRSSAAPRNLRDLHDGYGTGLPPGYPIRPDWIIHSLTELIL